MLIIRRIAHIHFNKNAKNMAHKVDMTHNVVVVVENMVHKVDLTHKTNMTHNVVVVAKNIVHKANMVYKVDMVYKADMAHKVVMVVENKAHITFDNYFVVKNSIKVGRSYIQECPTPKTVSGVESFHGLVSFYRRFVRNFSTLATLLNEIVKKHVGFKWVEK